MMKRGMALATWSVLVLGCGVEPEEETRPSAEVQEILENLEQAGFPADDIMIVDGTVYVGRDAEVSLAASREMLETGDSTNEQYRTTNLVSSSVTKICVNGPTFTGIFSTALDLAIQNYEEQPLRFAMARTPSSGCSFTINAVIAPGVVGGSAGFPSGGLPYSTIHIGDGLAPYGIDVIEHVITHELGHTIGFRHSDYYNRSISCGSGGNEGGAGVGAILIPGTPSTATVGGSLMNSCFRSVETGEFSGTDLTALRTLYPGVPDGAGGGVSGDFNGDGKVDLLALYDYGSAAAGLWVFPGTTGTTNGASAPYRVWYTGPGNFDVNRAKLP
ncbi:MAG TPA: M57 family metalloprotease [Kofleriaceae bacterium]|nr:M57 family metalloprotease [Kofleriaceae bacterium]